MPKSLSASSSPPPPSPPELTSTASLSSFFTTRPDLQPAFTFDRLASPLVTSIAAPLSTTCTATVSLAKTSPSPPLSSPPRSVFIPHQAPRPPSSAPSLSPALPFRSISITSPRRHPPLNLRPDSLLLRRSLPPASPPASFSISDAILCAVTAARPTSLRIAVVLNPLCPAPLHRRLLLTASPPFAPAPQLRPPPSSLHVAVPTTLASPPAPHSPSELHQCQCHPLQLLLLPSVLSGGPKPKKAKGPETRSQ